MIDITEAIITYDGRSLYEWFINQEHLPFDMSSDAHGTYLTLYNEFINELSGQLVSDEGGYVIPANDAYAIAKIAGIKMCQSNNIKLILSLLCLLIYMDLMITTT